MDLHALYAMTGHVVPPVHAPSLNVTQAIKEPAVVGGATEIERAVFHGLSLEQLQRAAGPDWSDIKDYTDMLHALADAIHTRRLRTRGEVPPDYTHACECAGCGPVWLWPGTPARVLGCPWCFNRAAGKPIPRPGSPIVTGPSGISKLRATRVAKPL